MTTGIRDFPVTKQGSTWHSLDTPTLPIRLPYIFLRESRIHQMVVNYDKCELEPYGGRASRVSHVTSSDPAEP
jgi:hypothetical protein